jgi:hypothetical protein
MTNRHLA